MAKRNKFFTTMRPRGVMNVWIATDPDGQVFIFASKPNWNDKHKIWTESAAGDGFTEIDIEASKTEPQEIRIDIEETVALAIDYFVQKAKDPVAIQ